MIISRKWEPWIDLIPLDGQGVKDINVTDYRFALVESDDMEIDKQNAIIRELELPVALFSPLWQKISSMPSSKSRLPVMRNTASGWTTYIMYAEKTA